VKNLDSALFFLFCVLIVFPDAESILLRIKAYGLSMSSAGISKSTTIGM